MLACCAFIPLAAVYRARIMGALGSGFWALGSGLWALGSGLWVLGSGLWALGSGPWALGFGFSDAGPEGPAYGYGGPTDTAGLRIRRPTDTAAYGYGPVLQASRPCLRGRCGGGF